MTPNTTPFATLEDFRVDMNNRIFVNRTLNMNSVKLIGFDMDYTLVLYNEVALEALAFTHAVDHLIKANGYPEAIRSVKFSHEKIIRGLVIDKKLGNLVKINRFGYIKAALHGERQYTRDEQKAVYANEIVSLHSERYEMIHTMFSLASSSLFCQLVDKFGIQKSYEDLYDDIRDTLDLIHRNGVLKGEIAVNPERYVITDRKYAETLKMFRASGKKLALITNSEWSFTQAMMSYSYDPFMGNGKTWRDLFDIVIVDAAKPGFFTGAQKFFEVIPQSGHLKNVPDKIKEGQIYQGGNASGVEGAFGVSSGEILYVGDHIYADVFQSKKTLRWRTMLVITELEAELLAAEAGRDELEKIRKLMEDKEHLELQLGQIAKKRATGYTFVSALQQIGEAELTALYAKIKGRILALDQETSALIVSYNARFNPHWGELMWAGNDKSHFGMIIERFACVYASKVSNLLYYSPVHYFRPKVKDAI